MENIINKVYEFLETYVEGSTIETIKYEAKSGKWIVSYEGNLKTDAFDSFEGMIQFFHADQFGD